MNQTNINKEIIQKQCLHIMINHDGNETYKKPTYELVR